ncbi:MAG TPA: TrkH family potassium uptake protein [Gaiellaceae bacterium]|nr:TrkH family potassium uptake protein [Gaiellaceae bacterium]
MNQAVARIGRSRRIAIDLPAAFNLVGTLAKYLGLAALFPTAVALWYSEPVWPFLAAGAITSGFGLALERVTAGASTRVGAREGFLVVSLVWLLAAAFAALPYLFAGGAQLGHPLDAYFEGMSGFTTTGSTVVTDYGALSHSIDMWRQFTQWLGGMGIIVLAIAVLPRLRIGGRQLMESELPGPELSQFSERIRSTARMLWLLYVALTALEALALASLGWLGVDDRMTPYEALAHAFTTMPTGGFSTQAGSLASFSAAAQWIVVVFMLLAGANFALLFRGLARRRPRAFLQDEEFRVYLALAALAAIVLTTELWSYGLVHGEAAIRAGVFQAVSLVTTTGYTTVDFGFWPVLVLLSLFALMFVGASAGSTGGSIKVVRHLLLAKILRRELDQTVSPNVVMPVRLNGASVDEPALRAISSFVLLYVGAWAVGAAIIAIDSAISGVGLGTLDSLAASATALGNIGPGFGITGPMGSFASLGDVSKLTLIGLMWIGRLEIVPVAVLLTRHYWRL